MKHKINFTRDGLSLVGNLFTPEGFDANGHHDAVIVEGSFSSVKEQMPESYAQKFADQGFVALAFDYSHYGESEGEPRQLESPAEKLSDLQAAVSYLTELPYVQAVGMVGVCTSAGNAAYLGAVEPRIKALATVAAFLPGPALFSLMYGEEGVAQRKQAAADARRTYEETGEAAFVPAYSEVDQSAVNYGPAGSFDYYLNEARGNVPEYRNESALMGLEEFLEFNPVSQASAITTPTIVVHSDESAFPDEAKKLYDGIQGEKELVWADGNHYDYYLNEARGNVPEYRNESALMGVEEFLDFNPVSQASAITTPTIVVHSDESAFPDEAKKLYDGIQGEKELVWADGNHYDYYLNEARGNVPEYRNESALMGVEEFLDFNPVSQASAITTPTIVVHSDESAFPDEAKKLYDGIQGEKELVWADGNHYDYYLNEARGNV